MNEQLEQKAKIVRHFFEKIFIECQLKHYRAYCNQEDFDEYEFDNYNSIEWEDLSPKLQHFEDIIDYSRYGDGISCHIYEVPIQDFNTITYRMETDGDDGWIVVFGNLGELFALGYTYIEAIEWESPSVLNIHSNNIDSSLLFQGSNMSDKTFWGKPLEEVEKIVKQRLQKNIFT